MFWLSDRTTLVDMLGDYRPPRPVHARGLPRGRRPVHGRRCHLVRPGTADPLAAIEWVRQQGGPGVVAGIVTLGDPHAAGLGTDDIDEVLAENARQAGGGLSWPPVRVG